MKHSRPTMNVLAFLVLSILSSIFTANAAGCDWMPCFESYDAIKFTNPSAAVFCPVIVDALNCANQLTGCGFEPALRAYRLDVEDKSEENNCTTPPPPTTATPNTDPPSCPSKLPTSSHIQNLSTADIVPKSSHLHVELCPPYNYGNHNATRHCSVHTYSHILPFHNDSLQDFILPGSYYILNHNHGVKIEIFTAVHDIQSPHSSSVQKIKVTIKSNAGCTGEKTFNYTATAADELPTFFETDDKNNIVQILYNPVELIVNEDRTVASIIATWLGLTAVIRRHSSHLSIVVQMPAELAGQSEGLCSTGAPEYSRYSSQDRAAQDCNQIDHGNALTSCSFKAGLLNIDPPNTALTYTYACTYDILQESSYQLLSLYQAIVSDLQALPSRGDYIIPNTLEPPELPIDTDHSTPSSTVTINRTPTTRTATSTATTSIAITSTATAAGSTTRTIATFAPQDRYSSAQSSYKRPSVLLVLSLCLCLLVTLTLS